MVFTKAVILTSKTLIVKFDEDRLKKTTALNQSRIGRENGLLF